MAEYNPFNPNSVVAPTLFAGRDQQVTEICKKLTQLEHNMPASFFIYGERGIGKTALAKLVKFIAASNDPELHGLNLLTSYYSAEKGQSINSVLQESVNKLTDSMDKSLVEKIGSRVGQLFKNGKFEIGAFGATVSLDTQMTEQQREITVKDQTVSILSNIVRELMDKSETSQDGILIIIDELHNLNNISGAASILRNIITSLDVEGLGKISFLLIGYEDDMKQFFSVDSSSLRTFDTKPLGIMPIDEAMDVLRKGFTAAEVKWDEQALLTNISTGGGYPHSIQILGHNLIERDKDGFIDGEDWSEVIFDTAIELQEKDFSTMYNFRKKQTERDKLLVILAQENKPLSRKEINDKHLVKNIYRCINELKSLGAIKEDDEEKIYLQSQLFRTAILLDLAVRKILANPTTLPLFKENQPTVENPS